MSCVEMPVIENLIVYIIALAILYAIYQFIILIIRVWKVCRLKRHQCSERDRQGNVFTIHDESNQANRYNDIFFIESNNAEAARARAQLEKDDKDLPTYEEVMRITASANSASTSVMGAASTSTVNTTDTLDTTIALPPYSDIFLIEPRADNNCEASLATSTSNAASTSTAHTTVALSSSLGFSNTISTQTQSGAPSSSSNV